MEDTTFHHALLNTRYYAHRVESDLHVLDKHQEESASLFRQAHLVRTGALAGLVMDSVHETGPLREKDGHMRLLTAGMYDDVFFPRGTWVATNRIVPHAERTGREDRFARYKRELKEFMFDPGKEIASVPIVGDKLALFDPGMAPLYEHTVSNGFRNGRPCWVFSVVARDSVNGKEADPDDIVIERMITWFDQQNMQVSAREYHLAYSSLLLDMDIRVRVDNTVVNDELVPLSVHYEGFWDIPFHKVERARFDLQFTDWQVPP